MRNAAFLLHLIEKYCILNYTMAEQKRTTCFKFRQPVIKNWPAFVLSMSLALGIPGCDAGKSINKVTNTDEIEILQPQEEIKSPPPHVVTTPIQPQVAAVQSQVTRPALSTNTLTSHSSSPIRKPTLTQAQIDAGWTPEKVATVEQYRRNLAGFRGNVNFISKNQINNILNNLDPILVGEHFICDNNWLEFIGIDKGRIPPQAFEMWVKRMDMAYKSFKELVGQAPVNGEVVFISVQPKENFKPVNSVDGQAKPHYNMFCINRDANNFETVLQEIAFHNSCSQVALHELAHILSHTREWATDIESIGNVLIAYAMETNPEIKYGGAPKSSTFGLRETSGDQYRRRIYELAWGKRNIAGIDHIKNVSDIYTMGLVGKVDRDPVKAWGKYKETFQSYHSPNPSFIPNKYEGDKYGVQTLDFLHRLEDTSGKLGLLQSLDDKGALLARLNTRVVQQNLRPTVGNNVQVADRSR